MIMMKIAKNFGVSIDCIFGKRMIPKNAVYGRINPYTYFYCEDFSQFTEKRPDREQDNHQNVVIESSIWKTSQKSAKDFREEMRKQHYFCVYVLDVKKDGDWHYCTISRNGKMGKELLDFVSKNYLFDTKCIYNYCLKGDTYIATNGKHSGAIRRHKSGSGGRLPATNTITDYDCVGSAQMRAGHVEGYPAYMPYGDGKQRTKRVKE